MKLKTDSVFEWSIVVTVVCVAGYFCLYAAGYELTSIPFAVVGVGAMLLAAFVSCLE